MCGIVGIWDLSRRASSDNLRENVQKMAAALEHRGPDDEGIYLEPNSCLALAHRRLSVIDPSSQGHQPMISSCGRFTIVYNGEIYNTAELADELVRRGRRFRGHSDTEVLLEGCAEYGIEKFIQRVNGILHSRYMIRCPDPYGFAEIAWVLSHSIME